MAKKNGNQVAAGRQRVVFQLPNADTPGYLMRQKRLVEAQQRITEDSSPESIDKIVDLLLEYVAEPSDKAKARMLIFTQLSKAEVGALLRALAEEDITEEGEGSGGAVVPPESGEISETG